MNTINKLKVRCNILEGLKLEILENSVMNNKTNICCHTIDQNLEEHFEFDRVFNNIDIIEGMLIGVMEKPHKSKKLKIRLNSIKAIKTYANRLVLLDKYENKIKG